MRFENGKYRANINSERHVHLAKDDSLRLSRFQTVADFKHHNNPCHYTTFIIAKLVTSRIVFLNKNFFYFPRDLDMQNLCKTDLLNLYDDKSSPCSISFITANL